MCLCVSGLQRATDRVEESFPPLVPTIFYLYFTCGLHLYSLSAVSLKFTPCEIMAQENECCKTLFLFMVAELDRAPGSFGFRSGSQDLKLLICGLAFGNTFVK